MTLIACVALYTLALTLLIAPTNKARCKIRGVMDRLINGWVAWNKFVVCGLGSIDIATDFPPELNDRSKWRVVVCNHQSWADIIVLQCALLELAPPIKFFTKRELIWVPFLGFALWLLRFPYVRRNAHATKRDSQEVSKHNIGSLRRSAEQFLERPITILSFCEGTRFTKEKHQSQRSPFEHLLLPKIGGLTFTLESLGNHVEEIVDATLVYDGMVPNFWDFLCGRCRRVKLHARLMPLTEVQKSSLGRLVRKMWLEKDQLIAGMQQID